MFEVTEMRELRDTIADFAHRFDPELIDGDTAASFLEDAAVAVNMLEAVKSLCVKRVQETHVYRQRGCKTAAHLLARAAGVTIPQARDQLVTAERLEKLPVAAAAQRQGKLSPQKTALVADAATADPTAEEKLVEIAERRSLGETKEECMRVKAAADPDPDATHRRVRSERFYRVSNPGDGSSGLRCQSTVDDIAFIDSVVRGFARTEFDKARLQGRREPAEAYLFDGLLAMAHAAAGNPQPVPEGQGKRVRQPIPVKLIFRVDWPAYLRGKVQGDEVCEIVGIGPIPPAVVKQMIQDCDPFIAAVLTRGEIVERVAHLGRRPTAKQLTALEWMQPTCTSEGCPCREHLQWDHRDDWAKTHVTPTGGLDHLCPDEHILKTLYGWALVEGTGKRKLVPPDHPDHPNNKKKPPPDP